MPDPGHYPRFGRTLSSDCWGIISDYVWHELNGESPHRSLPWFGQTTFFEPRPGERSGLSRAASTFSFVGGWQRVPRRPCSVGIVRTVCLSSWTPDALEATLRV